ncbi:MAG: PepSY-like domain-containing protein, partial [Alistipes sp.]|nr:PepSY-like domain-containing protein [Alistipes sp.]
NGEWEEVEAKRADFPMSVIPQAIRSYLHQHYPDAAVKQIDRDRYGYEVKLRSGLELEFDKDGRLLKIDD